MTITSTEAPDYVEIAVSDTGCGLTEEEQQHIFDHKPIYDQKDSSSHGFGLMNCKGIINKYKKISQIFAICEIGVESKKGRVAASSSVCQRVSAVSCWLSSLPLPPY